MSKTAVLLGYAGTGRELASWLPKLGYSKIIYLDDVVANESVVGTIKKWNEFSLHDFFATIGSYRSMVRRLSVLETIPKELFSRAVSPHAADYSEHLGAGCLIYPFSTICSNVRLGDFCLIYHSCTISHDSALEKNCIVSNGAVVSGGVTIGENCYIGANATILEGVSIGDNCIVAAGATVTHDVPPRTIYVNPKKHMVNKYIP